MLNPVIFNFDSKFDINLQNTLFKLISENLADFEVSTFILGVSWPKDASEETAVQLRANFQFELVNSLKQQLNLEVEPSLPEVTIHIDFNQGHVNFDIRPIYLYGRYQKFSRNLTQTFPYCFHCKGRGCRICEFKGREDVESVEELVAEFPLEIFQAEENKFHGAGREDKDVRMLGHGRAFVLELIFPKKRKLDLHQVEEKINAQNKGKIKITDLQFTGKKKIAEIKNAVWNKIYEATVECTHAVDKQQLNSLVGQEFELDQETPHRVKHRRAHLVRKKKIKILEISNVQEKSFNIKLDAQSGTYIKEFISSDQGRTHPSISSLLDDANKSTVSNLCECAELDVLEIIEQ